LYYLICLASRLFQPPWPGLSGAQLIAFTPSQRLYGVESGRGQNDTLRTCLSDLAICTRQ
jgi:hypothetical protein